MPNTLRSLRLAKEITKKEMADACGVHENTYAEWENNPENIKMKYAPIIAKKLSATINEISFHN